MKYNEFIRFNNNFQDCYKCHSIDHIYIANDNFKLILDIRYPTCFCNIDNNVYIGTINKNNTRISLKSKIDFEWQDNYKYLLKYLRTFLIF